MGSLHTRSIFMTLGTLLMRIVEQLGSKHIFGVPGDYNLRLLDYIVEDKEITWIGNCNELNAAYAADGYARENGIGVLVTTHGVGELSAANGIAGAFAHNVPILHIVGYPNSALLADDVPVHHTLGNFKKNNFVESFTPISGALTMLTAHNYIVELQRVISDMLTNRKPCYIGLPTDLVDMEIDEDIESISFHLHNRDSYRVAELGDKILERYRNAKHPVFVLGINIARFGWRKHVTELLSKTQSKFVTTLMGKSIINETNVAQPNYLGIYAADYSTEGIISLVQNSDCIISIGTVETDMNSGGFSEDGIDYAQVVAIKPESIKIGKSLYADISVEMLLEYLIAHAEQNSASLSHYTPPKNRLLDKKTLAQSRLNHEAFWPLIAEEVISEGDIVLAEAGSSLFGLLHQNLPAGIDFVSQILWASIGYTLPAAIGSAIASPDRRVLLFIGDGSLQLTAQEISLIAKYGLDVTIFLINNDGYSIERAIHGPTQSYNDIYMWQYLDMARALGIKETYQIKDFDTLFTHLPLMASKGAKMFELFFDKLDYPPLLKQISDKLEEANRQS